MCSTVGPAGLHLAVGEFSSPDLYLGSWIFQVEGRGARPSADAFNINPCFKSPRPQALSAKLDEQQKSVYPKS